MKSDLNSALSVVNSGKNIPAIQLVRDNPELAAAISKLIAPRDKPNHDNRGNRTITPPNQTNFLNISQDIAQKAHDAESIMQLFPDMELSEQILISSILSPKDMSKVELTFVAPDDLKSPEIASALITKIKDYFNQVYKIEPLLPKILREALFETGSYPIAVIPENSVDDLINGSSRITLEAIAEITTKEGNFKNIGILGNPVQQTTTPKLAIAAESFSSVSFQGQYQHSIKINDTVSIENLSVTDNFHALKLSKLLQKKRSQQIRSTIDSNSKLTGLGLESTSKKLSDAQLTGLLYKNKATGSSSFIKVKTNDELGRKPVGMPLIMKLPSEAVIPVHTPGDETKHVGYFVLIDGEGNPLNKNSEMNHFGDLQSRINAGVSGSNNMSSYLLERAKKSFGDNCTALSVDQATKVYADIIEADLLARLRNGVYGSNFNISRNEEVYRIMLSRTFQNQYTQLVYIPVDLVTYFAYKFDNRGIGKSLLDDMRILNSLRAMVLFSKVMAAIKNSIGRTQVDLKLDERDPNPQKTIETAIHEISKTRQQYFPLGLSTPGDLVDWIQKSGYEYTFSGHPGLPDTSINFSEKNSSYSPPDNDLEEELRKRAIMATGLSPEMVDNGFSSEFATTVVANNLLLSKRVLQIQEIFIPQVTDHIQKVVMNDGSLFAELVGIVKDNFAKLKSENEIDEDLLKENEVFICQSVVSGFIRGLTVALPQPNSVTLENQMTAFDAYVEALDKALTFYISSEVLTESFSGEAASRADELKNIVKAYFCRKWLVENNVLPELADLTIQSEDGTPVLDFASIQADHVNGIVKSVVIALDKMHRVGAAADKDIERITGGEDLGASSASPPDNDFSSSSNDTGTDPIDDDVGDDVGLSGGLPNLDDIPD